MREIKFRAWDTDNSKWLSMRWLVVDPQGQGLLMPQDGDCCLYDGCNYELMQYTGLKDKNGKEVYKGDVLKKGRYTYLVHRRETGLYEAQRIYKGGVINMGGRPVAYMSFEAEVIGNIYENPELLK